MPTFTPKIIGSEVASTSLSPTTIQSVGLVTPLSHPAPVPGDRQPDASVMPSKIVVDTTPVADLGATVLPGTIRKSTFSVTWALVQERIQAEPEVLKECYALLDGIQFDSTNVTNWLNFGATALELTSQLVAVRLEVVTTPTLRVVTQHLDRLYALLAELLDSATEKRLFKPSVSRVWSKTKTELAQLKSLLSTEQDNLQLILRKLTDIQLECPGLQKTLDAHYCALDYLCQYEENVPLSVITSRMSAIQSAQGLLVQTAHAIATDIAKVTELYGLITEGLHVKLPSVELCLTNLPDNATTTEHFVVRESLTSIMQFFARTHK